MDELISDLLSNCQDPQIIEDYAIGANCLNDPQVQRRLRELRDTQGTPHGPR